jgi:hypothetical protein
MARVELRNQGGQIGHLEGVCMCCGERAEKYVEKKLIWYPMWALITAPIVGGLILLMGTQRVAQLNAPFCQRHKGHWFRRALAGMGGVFLLLLLCPVAIVLSVAAEKALGRGNAVSLGLLLGWFVAFFGGMIALIIWGRSTTIRATSITPEKVVLVNVCERFAEAVRSGSSVRWDEDREEPIGSSRGITSRRDSVRAAAADVVRCVCAECQEEVQFSDRVRGFMVQCPKCRAKVEVPA